MSRLPYQSGFDHREASVRLGIVQVEGEELA